MKEHEDSMVPKKKSRVFASVLFMVAIFTGISFFLLAGCSTISGNQSAEPAAVLEAKNTAEQWGIEVVAVRMSAAGNMVDFRYKVLDSEKAEVLFSKKTKPYLIHQETGKVLAVPRTAKVGPLMSSYYPKQDRIYWMFFGNQTKLIKAGDEVSVVIGDYRKDHIVVQ